MKNFYILSIIIALLFNNLNAQVEEYLTIPNGVPFGLAVNGNDLFITDNGNAKIHKVDISQSTPSLTDFVTSGINLPTLIEISGNTLFIPQLSNLSSVDITQNNPSLNIIVPSNNFFGVAINGNDLYASLIYEGKIVKFDLTQTNPSQINVLSTESTITIRGIALNGNDLYMSMVGNENKIAKIDITQANPIVTDVISGVTAMDLLIVGNDLYFSSGNSVSKIDITQSSPTIETIIDNLSNSVVGIIISNNYIYMAQEIGKILRLDLNTLGLDNFEQKNQINIYPNPTSSLINISNTNEELKYKIVDLSGKVLMKGIYNNQIDISKLKSGFYLLKLDNKQTFKIIKN